MDPIKQITERIEEDYLKLLIQSLESNKISVLDAKSITSAYLALYPFTATDDMNRKLLSFTHNNPQFEPLYINYLRYAGDMKIGSVLTRMKSLIKENRIDEALQIAK